MILDFGIGSSDPPWQCYYQDQNYGTTLLTRYGKLYACKRLNTTLPFWTRITVAIFLGIEVFRSDVVPDHQIKESDQRN